MIQITYGLSYYKIVLKFMVSLIRLWMKWIHMVRYIDAYEGARKDATLDATSVSDNNITPNLL